MPTSDGGFFPFPDYGSYTSFTPALPQFYWDVYSAEQRIKHICYELDKLIKYSDQLGANQNWLYEQLAALKSELQELEGNIPEKFASEINAWIDSNMERIIKRSISQVYFGLTDDSYSGGAGYFVAYIPESWNEIVFDTGAVYGLDTYGRLILRWDADSPYSVEQTPEYSAEALTSRIGSIETTANDALALATTNETDIGTNDGEIADLQTRVTALESK